MKFFSAAVIAISTCTTCNAASLQVVSVDGTSRTASQIGSYVSSQPISQTGNTCPVTAMIDCTNDADGCEVLNSLFETSFERSSKGLCLDTSDRGAFLYTSFDSMFSSEFCGSKAADVCASVSSSVYVLVSAKDLTETLLGHDQIFRRILKKIDINSSPIQSIVVLVKTEAGVSSVSDEVQNRLSDIWNDIHGNEQALSDRISVEILPIDFTDPSAVESARTSVLTALLKQSEGADSVAALGVNLSVAWGNIPEGVPRAILNSAQRQSLLRVESAYTAGIAQIESVTGGWQSRIGDGKIVGKFGDRVQQLLVSVRKAYNARTMGSVTVRDRADRSRQLDQHLITIVTELFSQQLNNLKASTIIKFRKQLVSLSAGQKGLTSEEEQQALRRALFDLRAASSDLENESCSLSSAASQTEVSSILQLLASDFPETAAARLEEVRKVEKSTKRPPKTKGQKIVNIGLNLVGMLRPPGFGNLQGFFGYSTGFLGLPLELLLGVQNDGDTPEIMGEDREYPILRLQPKVHFDIDV